MSGAHGGARMHFYGGDSAGPAVLDVKLRGGACPALGEIDQ